MRGLGGLVGRIAFAVTASAALLAVGCGDGRVCSETSQSAECQPPDFELPPGGGSTAPSLDELLAAETPAATAAIATTAAGGTLTLGGFRLVIPAGAIPAGTSIEVRRHDEDIADAPAGTTGSIWRVVSPVQPTAPVSLTLPLPGAAGGDPSHIYVMHHREDRSHPVVLTGTVDTVANTVTVSVDHFSNFFGVDDLLFYPSYYAGIKTLIVPYYGQGDTENCWSVALSMLFAAYGANVEPWENSSFYGIGSEHGLPYWAFAHTLGLVRHLQQHLGTVRWERKAWWTSLGEGDALKTYLMRTLWAERPVMVFLQSPAPHMVLFVGVAGPDTFVVHDPSRGPYVRMTWAEILPRLEVDDGLGFGFDGTATLALATPMPAPRWRASILLPHARTHGAGLDLMVTGADGRFDTARTLGFSWYVPDLFHEGFASVVTGRSSAITPEHRAFLNVEVTSTDDHGAPARTFVAGFELRSQEDNVLIQRTKEVTLAGAEQADVVLLPGDGRDRGEPWSELGLAEAGRYRVTLFVEENGSRFDTIDYDLVVPELGDPRLNGGCSKLTTDFRADCGAGNDCNCIGNQFCNGFFAEHPAAIDCSVASEECGEFCLFWDYAGVCDCARYCGMFVDRLGCSKRIDCADVMAEYGVACDRAEITNCGCMAPSFCDQLLIDASQLPDCHRARADCQAHCATRDLDGECGCSDLYCNTLLAQLGCTREEVQNP